VSNGISVESESLATPVISYRIKALQAGFQAIDFTILTSDGRVNVRRVNFEVNDA
jgi:hypothetical protein